MNENELLDILSIPIEKIMMSVIAEAQKDLKITEEETRIIDDIKKNIDKYEEDYQRLLGRLKQDFKLTKGILEELVDEQNQIFLRLIEDTKNQIEKDGIVSSDEVAIFRSLTRELDLVIKKRIKQLDTWE
ncbi:MAG: hypothetical protein ACXAD7_04885 [Candidatus Kariarchaeaceae archaeon]|jgi:threonine aldolase